MIGRLTGTSDPAGAPALEPVGTGALYDVDPELIAAVVLGCPAVAALSGGPSGTAATYLPGRKVPGVRLTPTAVVVHVVARYGPPVGEVARQIRTALGGLVSTRVDVVVEDLLMEPVQVGGPLP